MREKERIDFLRKELEDHNHLYYVLDSPKISDFEFDKLMSELINLEEENPQFHDENSPTKKVGGRVMDSFKTVDHQYPMLSLSNTYNAEELQDFDERIKKRSKRKLRPKKRIFFAFILEGFLKYHTNSLSCLNTLLKNYHLFAYDTLLIHYL